MAIMIFGSFSLYNDPDFDLEAYALQPYIRSISKIRIIRLKTVSQGAYHLTDERLLYINEKMKELFF